MRSTTRPKQVGVGGKCSLRLVRQISTHGDVRPAALSASTHLMLVKRAV